MKNLNKLISTVVLTVIISGNLIAKDIHVATWGNNNWAGTSSKPYKTIQKAAAVAKWGDNVYVKGGNYYGNVNVATGGVSFYGSNRTAVLKNGAFRVIRKNRVKISGFKIMNGLNGVYAEGPANNLIVENNHTYNTQSSGIGVWGIGWDPNGSPYYGAMKNVRILNNKIEKACNGGWNECITLAFGVEDFLIKGNEILNGGDPVNGGEGIDVKGLCRNGTIENNHVHHLTRRGIYIDGGKTCYNIAVTNNNSHHNAGHGLAIMSEASGDVHDITIKYNKFHNNTEDGIMIYKHPNGAGSNVYNVFIQENEIYNNNRYGVLLAFAGSTNIQVCNNTMSANTQGNLRVSAGGYVNCSSRLKTAQKPNKQEGFNIYPNPVSGEALTINITLPTSQEVGLEVFNNMGKLIHTQKLGQYDSGTQIIRLNTSALGMQSKGIYFIKTKADNKLYYSKVVVE